MEFNNVKDSGNRKEFVTGSVRDTREGKGRFDLIPSYPLRRLARHYENGAKKYGDWNWLLGQNLSRYIDSAERHLCAVKEGLKDEDHEIAVAWNIFAFIETKRLIDEGQLPAELNDMVYNIEDAKRMVELEKRRNGNEK
jgi:hypothetical protein